MCLGRKGDYDPHRGSGVALGISSLVPGKCSNITPASRSWSSPTITKRNANKLGIQEEKRKIMLIMRIFVHLCQHHALGKEADMRNNEVDESGGCGAAGHEVYGSFPSG